jgi:hypothetical protein
VTQEQEQRVVRRCLGPIATPTSRPYRWRCACGAVYRATRRGYGTCSGCERKKALADLRTFYERNGRAPKVPELRRKHGLPSYRTVLAHFGSAVAWIRAAGIEPRTRGQKLNPYRGGSRPARAPLPKAVDPAVVLYRKEKQERDRRVGAVLLQRRTA